MLVLASSLLLGTASASDHVGLMQSTKFVAAGNAMSVESDGEVAAFSTGSNYQSSGCQGCVTSCASGDSPVNCRESCEAEGKCEPGMDLIPWNIFLDIQCPYSKKAWNNLEAFREKFGKAYNIQPSMYSLTFHMQAFIGHKVADVVAEKPDGLDADAKWAFVKCAYERQDEYFNSAMGDPTKGDIAMKFAQIAVDCDGTGISDVNEILDEVDGSVWKTTWSDQKFALNSGAVGAPSHVIGGKLVPDTSSSWSADDWEAPLKQHTAALVPTALTARAAAPVTYLLEEEDELDNADKCERCVSNCVKRKEKKNKPTDMCRQLCENRNKCEPAPEPTVSWQIYLDIQCAYSKKTWNNVESFRKAYGGRFNITTHLYDLAFHYQAFPGHKAAVVVADMFDDAAKWKFVGCAYERQTEYMNAASVNAKKSDIANKFTEIAADCLGDFNTTAFAEAVEDWNSGVKPAWNEDKVAYAAGARGAPFHNICGVPVADTSSSWSAEDWESKLIEHMEVNCGGW